MIHFGDHHELLPQSYNTKFIYINRLTETLAFYYFFGCNPQLIQFLSCPTLFNVFCDSCVCVSKHVLVCVCCLCVKYDSMCVYCDCV